MAAKYEKVKELGCGSFGKAWLALDKISRNKCVLKEIRVAKLSDKEIDQALAEVAILAKCKHHNVIRYVDAYVDRDNGTLNIAMEYADGGDLQKAILQRQGLHFSKEVVLDWFLQICLALKFIHSAHILHRDLKPPNIFLTSGGTVKLGDFGIAKVLQGTMDHALTTIGTPYYLSPEICQKLPYSYTSDIWAAGCVLYEMCCLRVPFDAANFPSLVIKILEQKFPPVPVEFGPLIEDLINIMLQTDPAKRPSASEILNIPSIKTYIRNNLQHRQGFEEMRIKVQQETTKQGAGRKCGARSHSASPMMTPKVTEIVEEPSEFEMPRVVSECQYFETPGSNAGKCTTPECLTPNCAISGCTTPDCTAPDDITNNCTTPDISDNCSTPKCTVDGITPSCTTPVIVSICTTPNDTTPDSIAPNCTTPNAIASGHAAPVCIASDYCVQTPETNGTPACATPDITDQCPEAVSRTPDAMESESASPEPVKKLVHPALEMLRRREENFRKFNIIADKENLPGKTFTIRGQRDPKARRFSMVTPHLNEMVKKQKTERKYMSVHRPVPKRPEKVKKEGPVPKFSLLRELPKIVGVGGRSYSICGVLPICKTDVVEPVYTPSTSDAEPNDISGCSSMGDDEIFNPVTSSIEADLRELQIVSHTYSVHKGRRMSLIHNSPQSPRKSQDVCSSDQLAILYNSLVENLNSAECDGSLLRSFLEKELGCEKFRALYNLVMTSAKTNLDYESLKVTAKEQISYLPAILMLLQTERFQK